MSVADYVETRKRQRVYDKWAEQYFKRNGFVPFDVEPPVKFTDKDRSYLERVDFIVNQPEKYFVYVDEKRQKVTTFTGDVLGTIIQLGQEVSDNFGGVRQFIKVVGINGVKYYGWYFTSSGDYVRIIAYKEQDETV